MITVVFKVVGYSVKTPDGNFMESCIFWVYAKTAKEAIEKVKKYKVDKKFYEVLEVIEKLENAQS